jgi:cold shock CspA family protein
MLPKFQPFSKAPESSVYKVPTGIFADDHVATALGSKGIFSKAGVSSQKPKAEADRNHAVSGAKIAPPLMPSEPPSLPASAAAAALAAELAEPPSSYVNVPDTSDGLRQTVSRYLGTVKSYSSERHFGFMTCPDVQTVQGDVFFDQHQVVSAPSGALLAGTTTEFTMVYNQKGQPQARQIDFSPIPLQPGINFQPQVNHAGVRIFNESSMVKVRKLLNYLNARDLENAIVTAIDYQGKRPEEAVDPDIDYVVFVLDRIGTQAVHETQAIKDIQKLLLLLMLSKMLRRQCDAARAAKLGTWLKLLAETLDPTIPEVRKNISSVVDMVTIALDENWEIPYKDQIRTALASSKSRAANGGGN